MKNFIHIKIYIIGATGMTASCLDLIKVTLNNYNFSMYVTSDYYNQYLSHPCENYFIDLLLRHLKSDSLFIDIGAHYGYSTIAAGIRYKTSQIFSFESSPKNFNILRKNIELNDLDNVKLFNYILSEKNEIEESINADYSDICSLYKHLFDYTQVPIIIKITVEGHELSVLNGLEKLLRNADNVELFIEINPQITKQSGSQPEKLIENITSLGFDIFLIENEQKLIYKLDKSTALKDFYEESSSGKKSLQILCIKKERSFSLLIFSHSSEMAGAEISLLDLTKELISERNVLCTVVMPGEGPLKNALKNAGASVISLNYSWWCAENIVTQEISQSWLSISLNNLNHHKKTFSKINPDIVLTNTIVIPWGTILAHQLDKPHIWHIHEFGNFHFFLPFPKVLEFIKASNLIFTSSDFIRKARNLNECDKAFTIYNHINIHPDFLEDTSKTYFSRQSATKLIITGYVSEYKGQVDAIYAVKHLIDKKYDVELAIVGPSNQSYLEYLKKIVVEEDLKSNVKFFGFNPNPFPAVKQADIVLHCSRDDSIPRVIVEAMLLKKPVISTNVGGIPEIIKEGFNGLFYDLWNNCMLADKIEYLINCPEKRKELGEHGSIFVKKRFTKDGYGGEIYRRLFSVKGAPSPKASPILAYMIMLMDWVINSEYLQKECLEKHIIYLESQVQALEQAVLSRESQVQAFEQAVLSRESQVQAFEQVVVYRDSRIQALEQAVVEMEKSITFRLTAKFDEKLLGHIFPTGSQKRKIYDFCLKGGRILVNEGGKSAWWNFNQYLRIKRS